MIDAKRRIEAFNPGAERLFGYPESELVGRNVSTLMPSPDHEGHDGYLARYLETGAAKIIGVGRQVTGRRRDGTTFPLHLSVGEMSIRGERKFTGMLHDLSERMRLDEELRASEARWRSVIDSAVDGIVVIDAHGRIEAFNPAAERLFGYEEREVIGRNVNILMPSPYHEEHDAYLARHLATGVQKIIGTGREVTGLRRDGTTFPLHLSVGKMTVGGERKFTGILHDLSARVRIEEQLREQSSLARLGEMAAVIAHEVKNPLAGVRGAVQVIGTRLPKDSKDAVMVKEIVSRIDALNELMQDLLLFARPPQPKPALVDVVTVVTTTADLIAGDPTLKDVRVSVDGAAPPILADAELLKIVFVNLLVNAAHAMQGRGTIRVTFTSMADTCQIAVADEGPGIPIRRPGQDLCPLLHHEVAGIGSGFADSQAPRRGTPRQHSDRMSARWRHHRHRPTTERACRGGDVAASSVLPAWSHSCNTQAKRGAPSRYLARQWVVEAYGQVCECGYFPMSEKFPSLRVLVVEDELLIRWSIAETLAGAGHNVLEAGDGASAVQALRTAADADEAIDAVVLDYRLPDSNDLTLLATIRRLSPESAVILMTAFGTPEVTDGARELGAVQVLHKPFDMHALEPLVVKACGSKLHRGR